MDRKVGRNLGDGGDDEEDETGHDAVASQNESWTTLGQHLTGADKKTGTRQMNARERVCMFLPSSNGTTQRDHLSMSALETSLGDLVALIEQAIDHTLLTHSATDGCLLLTVPGLLDRAEARELF